MKGYIIHILMFKLRLILNLWDKNGERIETQKEKQITKWQIVTKSSSDITVNYNLSSILLILMYKEKNEWSWYLNSGLFRKIDNTVMCVENGGGLLLFFLPLYHYLLLFSFYLGTTITVTLVIPIFIVMVIYEFSLNRFLLDVY